MKTQAIAPNTQTLNLQPATVTPRKGETKKRQIIGTMLILSVFVLVAFASIASAQELSPLNIGDGNHSAHVLPPPGEALLRQSQPLGPLTFKGGPVMGAVDTYAIYWQPPTLQDGSPTSMSPSYRSVLNTMLRNYSGHGIDNNNTQYYSNCLQVTDVNVLGGGTSTNNYSCLSIFNFDYYIPNAGSLRASYTDTTLYPLSGCPGGGNCISDTQIRAEIQRVMNLNGWTGGLNKMFLLFTSKGEGSCFGSYCAYSYYCAYHSDINNAGTAIIYGNEPYGEPAYCQAPGTPSPNNDAAADTAATAASHELTEAITDPLPSALPAWQTASGEEIGDLCAYNYGTNTWDSGKANQMWSGAFFEVQTEYDNHTSSCVQVGP